MAVYGQYETVAELGRTGITSVSRARPADGGWDLTFVPGEGTDLGSDAQFALKAFHVRRAEDAGEAERQRFLDRVRAQKRIADTPGARHWAPILDAGVARTDAYYVTRYYPRTAAKIANDRSRPVDARTLYGVVMGALEGLLELRNAQGRPHGNVKATNILITSDRGEVAPQHVVLTDPALEQDATIAGEVEDLFNLGEVIHELVLHTRFAGQHVWPVQPSREWAALGDKGDRWLGLCNHLLSPRAAENWLRVDDILDEVAALRPRRKRFRSRKLVVATLAVLTLVCGAGAAGYVRYTHQWRDLCLAYDEWVGPLDQGLAAATPPEVSADPYLNDHLVRPLAAARQQQLDPRAIAAASDQPPASLAQHPPLSFTAAWKTEQAWHVVHKLDQDLAPGKWDALTDLTARKADYEKRGWSKLAQYATTLLDAGKRPAAGGAAADWPAALATVVEGRHRLQRLDAARGAARARQASIVKQAEPNPVIRDKIAEFEAFLRVSADADVLVASAPAVDSLTRQLTEAEQTAAKFDAAIPLIAEAARHERAYELRGWTGPAKYLAALLDRAQPNTDPAGLPEALALAKRGWDQADAAWARIEERRRLLETSGDRILATYRNRVALGHLVEQSDLAGLARALEQVDADPDWAAVAARVADPEFARVDVAAFATKSQAHHGFAGRNLATPADLKKWLADLDAYPNGQLASATMSPSNTGDQPKVVTLPKPPTTLASAAPTTAESIKPNPTTVAVASPNATTQKTNTSIAMVVPPTTAHTSKPPPTTVASVPQPVTKPAAPPQPSPEELRLKREIAAFVSECREIAISAANPDVKHAWRARNDQIADRVEKNPKLYTPALRAERDKLRARLLQLDSAFKSADAPLALKPGAADWNKPLVKALQDSAPHWTNTLKELIGLASTGDPKFDDALAGLVDADEQWRATAARLVTDANRLQHLLDTGYGPGDKAPDGTALSALLASIRSADPFKYDAVQQALEPLIRPVAVVETEKSPSAMRLLAESGDQPLGVRLAAWFKAGGGNVTKETLESDLKTAGALLAAAQAKAPDKPRVDWLKARLETDVRSRWETFLDSAAKDADVRTAIALKEKITGVDAEHLSPRAKYNLALHDLRTAMTEAKEADPQKIAPLAQRLQAATAALDTAQARESTVSALSAELARLGQSTRLDVTKLGPLSDAAQRFSGGKIAWSAAAEENGDRVTYRASIVTDAGKDDVTLIFRRVRPSGSSAGRSSWVCTSETSLGTFADLLSAAGKWPDLRAGKFLWEYNPTDRGGDPRSGPRVWEWPRYGRSKDVTWTRVWLASPGFVPDNLEHYPPGIAAEFNPTQIGDPSARNHPRAPELNPSRRQPMQYVSPAAAQLAAAVVGCRLPTVAEWQAAHESPDQSVALNLRDRTWRLELDHLSQPPFANRCRPDAGIFVPAGEQRSDRVYLNPDGGEKVDGILWFREAPMSAAVFVDLVGNVAEYVTDDAGNKVFVIGGSSLSPPTRDLNRPYPVDPDQAAHGFSDVGFRLAFAEPAPPIEKLRDAVAGNWYLTK